MKLRYRLFLWIAAIFTVAFVVSFYWEEKATRRNLEITYNQLLDQLDQINQRRTKAVEDYLSDMLYKIQAEVDAVLLGVANYDLVRKGFEPTNANLKDGNWLDSASLMITNKWIDFIQSTNENHLMSEIIIAQNSLDDSLHFPVDDTFHLVATRSSSENSQWSGPYIGVYLDISTLHGEDTSSDQSDEDYFVFFTPEAIQNLDLKIDPNKNLDLSINLLEPFLKWMELPAKKYYLTNFIDKLLEVQKHLKERPEIVPDQKRWSAMISEKLASFQNKDACFEILEGDEEISDYFSDTGVVENEIKFYVKEYIEHYNKVGLIWGLATLTNSSIFGDTPLSPMAPIGMGMVDKEHFCGKSLLSRDVFFDQPRYNVEEEIQEMKELSADFLTTHLDVIALPEKHHVYFGNTLRVHAKEEEDEKVGYLTVGAHGGTILGSLSKSTHQTALFVSNDKIISVTNPSGDEIEEKKWYDLPTKKLLSSPSGIIDVDGEEYFFLHIIPYRKLDVHFFIFQLKSREFALVNSIRKGAEDIVDKISLQMRLAAVGGLLFVLVLLNNISKRITRPISHLADVTKTVADGKLDAVEIPSGPKKKSQDEVDTLYHSFFEMIKGLREKERVRGILNKVVSEEIAEEALKGNIQLGGEEKRVTVLFADIRGFSDMTEKMDPKEVIQLINTCMTKVSEKIDAHGGVIDKYVGDEVMALFGAPIDKPGSALQAVQSAIDMVDEIKKWNIERKEKGLTEIEMGIGIHTGVVVAGNMGAENRLNYTVLGANVNLASRICSEAEGMQVLISEDTLEDESVKGNIEVEKKEEMELKGFTKPKLVYVVKSYRR